MQKQQARTQHDMLQALETSRTIRTSRGLPCCWSSLINHSTVPVGCSLCAYALQTLLQTSEYLGLCTRTNKLRWMLLMASMTNSAALQQHSTQKKYNPRSDHSTDHSIYTTQTGATSQPSSPCAWPNRAISTTVQTQISKSPPKQQVLVSAQKCSRAVGSYRLPNTDPTSLLPLTAHPAVLALPCPCSNLCNHLLPLLPSHHMLHHDQ